ncbi:MAG TPA: hypothetical protein VH062_37115 [Polyangiaceae bacterium]|jgi:hypothetical protein|nr:hypothetical protein [Polyangiaceae bacterium]
MRHRLFFTFGALSLFGCSASTGTGTALGSGATSGKSRGGSGTIDVSSGGAGPTMSGNAGGTSSGTGSTMIGPIPTTGTGGSGAGGACAALVLKPEAVTEDKMVPMDVNCTAAVPEPIAIYIMLDNSGSMKDDNKWPDAVDAITMFVQSDPTATGAPWSCVDKDGNAVMPPASLTAPGTGAISVAIQYFHPTNAGKRPNECDGTSHRTPAVPMGPLPANGPNIVTSLNGTSPNSDTPTVGALTGGTEYCADYQTANPGKKCVVVLVTDGQPNACGLSSNCANGGGNGNCVDPNSASILVPIASNAFMMNGVITFTMGMNGVSADGFTLLNQIAVAGGSDCTPGSPGNETCDITTSGSKGFLDALNTIRKTVQVTNNSMQTVTTTTTQHTTLQCQWGIPQAPAGQTFDEQQVNISVTVGGTKSPIGNVADASACAAASGGWYYDNAAAPTRILACPDTCTTIQSTADAQVDVLLGCATQPATVR